MRGIETRLMRLETKRGPKPEARFYVFGIDEADTSARIGAAIHKGAIGLDDAIRPVIWRGTQPPPAPHWAAACDMGEGALDDAIATLSQTLGRPVYQRGDLKDANLDAEILAVRALIAAQPAETSH